MQRTLSVLLLFLMFAACDEGGRIPAQPGSAGILPPADGAAQVPFAADRRIVRTGELDLRVTDLEVARRDVLGRVVAAGGYVAEDARESAGRRSRLVLRVCVPADRFEAFAEATKALGILEHYHIEAADVTAEWVDVEARLVVLREMEKRGLALIARAENVSEVLVVQREIGKVQADIESMAAKMRSLRERVAMSTLTITCRAPRPVGERDAPEFAAAFSNGWDGLVRLAIAIVHVWPLALLVLPFAGWGVVRRLKKRVA